MVLYIDNLLFMCMFIRPNLILLMNVFQMKQEESILLEKIKSGDEKAYKYLYDNHYLVLCKMASQYLHDDFLAESIVGDVIFHIWEIRCDLYITTSIRSFLVKCVRNKCLDYIRSQYNQKNQSMTGLVDKDLNYEMYAISDDYPLGTLLEKELENEVNEAVERLPEKCKMIFKMSRFEGKKGVEIAKELNVSINTVKYHLKNALAYLYADLNKYLIMIFLLVIFK